MTARNPLGRQFRGFRLPALALAVFNIALGLFVGLAKPGYPVAAYLWAVATALLAVWMAGLYLFSSYGGKALERSAELDVADYVRGWWAFEPDTAAIALEIAVVFAILITRFDGPAAAILTSTAGLALAVGLRGRRKARRDNRRRARFPDPGA